MIKRVTEADFDKYEEFLVKHENGHFMQSLSWARFKNELSNVAFMCVDEAGNIKGVMSLFVQPVSHTSTKLLYCPRGPICKRGDTETLSELISAAREEAKRVGAYKITFDPDVTEKDSDYISCFKENGAKIGDNARDNGILQPFSVFRIDIGNKTDDELIASFHSKARYSVRASIKSGAVCRIGEKRDIPSFCALLAETAKRDGFTARGEKYFNKMFDVLPEENVKLFIVELEGKIIAGSVLIRYGKKTWHMYAGSDDAYKDALPNFLMQWEMMRWSISEGCSMYDMRGIAGEGNKLAPLEGLVRFKKRFGGELVSFVGRIDIICNPLADFAVKSIKTAAGIVRKITGRK